jgi:hypothetical protein
MTAPAYDRTIPADGHGGRFNPDPPAFDVSHSTEGPMSDGNAAGLAAWFARDTAHGGPGTSATRIFAPSASVRMLDEHTVPYHVGPVANALCTGDEHCGSVNLTPAQWMSPRGQAMLDRSAKVKAQRARYRGWKLSDCRWLTLTEVARRTVRGFCTHNDVRLALGGTTHSDPGPNFPYAWYMDRIRAWYTNPTNAGDDMPLNADDKTWLTKTIHDQVQAAVQAILKGGGNSSFNGLPVGEATAVQQVEDKLGEVQAALTALTPPAPPAPPTPPGT